jgi:hypothetical protein
MYGLSKTQVNKHVVDDVVFSRAKGMLSHDELVKIDKTLKNSTFIN